MSAFTLTGEMILAQRADPNPAPSLLQAKLGPGFLFNAPLGSVPALSSLTQETSVDGSDCPSGMCLVPFTEAGGWQSAKKKGEKILSETQGKH